MPSRTLPRLFTIVTTALVGVAMLLPAQPAQAYSDPPFELRFPQETEVTDFFSSYGVRRPGGRRHKGNDLMAPKMTEVYSIADGVVDTVGTSRRSGRYLKIDHGEGWTSVYIHLNNDNLGTDDGKADWSLTIAPGVEEGSEVKAGQLIGWVGDSGNAEWTGPHTHFELRHSGRAVNPYRHLRAAWERDHARYLWNLERMHQDLDLDQIV